MNDFGNDKCDVVTSTEIGRYVVAKKPLKQGDLLLCEEPIFVGLSWGSALLCLECYKDFSDLCNKCHQAPLCDCCTHDSFECNFLATVKLPPNFIVDNFDVVTPLRFIMLSQNPAKTEAYKEVMRMESHCTKRRGTPIWLMHENCVVKPLIAAHIIRTEDASLIQRYCGIMDVNAFEVRSDTFEQIPIRGLYPKAALLSHDCIGNTFVSLDENRSLRIFSATDIDAGMTIYNNYTFALALSGTEVRRQHLMEGKYFHCQCSRCMDPTEMKTHLSSIRCRECEKGMVVYEERSTNWRCDLCNKEQTVQEVNAILIAAKSKCELAAEDSVHMLEQLIETHSRLLNPNHYLVIDLKQKLAAVLRNICEGGSVLQPALLRRKIELCKDILSVIGNIQPELSRLKGIALYEYFDPMAELTMLELNDRKISINEAIVKLQATEQLAKESIKMLLYEPKSTPEGHLAKYAMGKLKSIRENINRFKKLLDNN